MITLEALAALAAAHPEDLTRTVAPLRVGSRTFDTDREPVLMGTVNLSRDSTYRDSVSPSTEAAVRRGRVLAAQGAHLVDVGAESSTAAAARVDTDDQLAALLPVVRALAADGVAVSAETYRAEVAAAALDAGAAVVNLTGSGEDAEVFDVVAGHGATLVLCHAAAATVRDVTDVELDDPFPGLLAGLGERVERARAAGVEHLVVDPGLGFYYGNLTDPLTRVRHQTRVLLSTFRLRALGLPVCHAVPHAFDLFEDEFRTAEAFFAVLARLGGTGVVRTHEVPRVRAVLRALGELDAG